MALTGEAKKKYQRELMAKRRSNTGGLTGSNAGLTEANKQLQRRVIELEAEVSRLKQMLAQRPTIKGPEAQLPQRFANSPFSRAAQASGKAMPNNSPLGRMAQA